MAGLGSYAGIVRRRGVFLGLLAVLAHGGMGCLSLSYERDLMGKGAFLVDATPLTPGESTLQDVLDRLGPPDLILRAGYIDRAYYVSWDSEYLKFVLGATIPTAGRSFSWDLFILALGGEEMRLARLEFDRNGVLRDLQRTTFEASRGGQYFSIHDRIVSTFLEDRQRALWLKEEDDDEEDVELDAPKKENGGR